MAENTTDRRVRKTRGQLRQGLVRLMREKSIQDITVKELCEECDINRGTFYLHYTDVYQLLHSIEDELLVEFERVLDGLDYAALARIHGRPAAYLRTRYHRAKKQLASRLREGEHHDE